MDVDTAKHGEDSAAEVYAGQLEQLQRTQAMEQRREKLLGVAKLVIALLTLIAAALLIHHAAALVLLLIPVALFVVLAALQEKLVRAVRSRGRAIVFYERGLARLDGRWAGDGETGERFLDSAHPYARDLDLFGKASLFEFLCTVRTRAGEETLAQWLLAAAPVDEIVARQGAVRELEGRVKFRETLSSLGETVRLGVQPESVAGWGERKAVFGPGGTRVLTTVLAILWVASLACWVVWGSPLFALGMTLLNFAYSHHLHVRVELAAESIEKAADDLKLLAEVLALLEKEHFVSPKLVALQDALKREGIAPSKAVRKLAGLVDYLESRHNIFARPFDILLFWSAQLVFRAEKWQREFGPAIRGWIEAVGEFEALTALSAFAYEHPGYGMPEFIEKGPLFDAEGLAHPLLPAGKAAGKSDAVENDVKLGDRLQLMVLSGPNMAGKSTFMRSIGVNTVLAQCGAPVRARRLTLSPLRVAASICVLDSLTGGISRFYGEIHRIKLITDLAAGPVPVLFLLDELLSGTNSHDRLVGTQFVLETLVARNAIGIVSTHDLALARIPETMGEQAVNYHFEDRFEDGKLIFDYKLKPGIVQTSNALELMRSIGLGVTRT